MRALVGVVVGVGVVLCENCIVDASIFIFCKFYCVTERGTDPGGWCV